MGYTKIVQYGDKVEVFEYEKNLTTKRRTPLNSYQKKRLKQKREFKKRLGLNYRSAFSVRRATREFFRLVHHNNCNAKTIHFLTLTYAEDCLYKEAQRYNSEFFRKAKEKSGYNFSYISVPEKTKKGRWHFHILIYNLPTNSAKLERKTRNFQRCFERGYVDLRLADTVTTGLAGYLAKYMAKTMSDTKYEAVRAYTCSRNIEKVRSSGGNTLDQYMDMLVPDSFPKTTNYEVPFLGKCVKKEY